MPKKQCPQCMQSFDSSHWAAGRQTCPTCGRGLVEISTELKIGPAYARYDSSADMQFDLEGLLTVDQRREALLIGWLGLGLLAVIFVLRLGFAMLIRTEGFWGVPLWFDLIIGGALFFSAAMMVYAARKLWCHRKAMRSR